MEMSIEEYSNAVIDIIRSELDDDCSASYKEITKNNNFVVHGVSIEKEGRKINPTFYTDSYYDHRIGIESAARDILDNYEDSYDLGFDLNSLMDFDIAKNNIIFKIINAKKNEEYLKNYPHVLIYDMAVICVYYNNEKEISINISNEMLKQWGITKDELIDYVKNNNNDTDNYVIMSMTDLMEEIFRENGMSNEEIEDIKRDNIGAMPFSMFVISNKNRVFGASAITNKEVLETCTSVCGGSYYILPSSIHELIVVPDSIYGLEVDKLRKLVNEVNISGEIKEDEVLSDSVYYYDAVDSKFYITK